MSKGRKLSRKLLKWEEILKPGTPFWRISLYEKQKRVKCPVCKGKGRIELSGKDYECPECSGIGYKRVCDPESWHVDGIFNRDYCVVTRVEISQVQDSDLYEVMYWDGCNGFPAERCFTSHNKAARKCKELNKKLEESKSNLALT